VVPHGLPLSDDFAGGTLKPHWQFLSGSGQMRRVRVADGQLHLRAAGSKGPGDSPPLGFIQGDPAFELSFDLDFDEGVQAGVVMFYSPRLYAGMGANASSCTATVWTYAPCRNAKASSAACNSECAAPAMC
jgi:beta-xylosidase